MKALMASAKKGLKSLECAIQMFYVYHRSYPQKMVELSQRRDDGSPAFLKESALTDPWGRPYEYDPNLAHPKTGIPLIWSKGPNPKDSSGIITNCDPVKK